ncbi:boron transporter 4-like isoform X1 [Camellia sinensis]|uniref:boron transporter 4-like isoform X1 n=1 Tax=Camellia sinensis TaxID=4442 RepID=UPI0010358944|nr:boron transporter 4-like isoform X1 [Camellia sinensis]
MCTIAHRIPTVIDSDLVLVLSDGGSPRYCYAVMIAGLYFFDHSVASQKAQQKFNLKNPSAYHYDIVLLGFMTLLCGLIGLPLSNGVIPQSPMHTKSLVVLKRKVDVKNLKTMEELFTYTLICF